MFVIRVILASLAITPALLASAKAQPQDILGIWWTEDNKGRAEIAKCTPPRQGLCGTIVWISKPNDDQGRPQTDKKNKDPRLRGRPIIGLAIFEGWRPVGRNTWKGDIYDPEEGETYDVDITLSGDRLTLKGCVLFLCDSETWTRYHG
jgi:uncharacterized protein (DUF2147 family)